MPRNERLAELTSEDLGVLETHFRANDPVNKLHHKLYGHQAAREGLDKLVRENIALFPDAVLPADPRAVAGEVVRPLIAEIESLKKTLADGDKASRRRQFVQDTIEAGAEPEDVDKIHTFMYENEIGGKALRHGVEAFYRTREAAMPNATDGLGLTFEPPGGGDDNPFLKQILGSGPGDDLTDLTTRLAEHTFGQMSRAATGSRR